MFTQLHTLVMALLSQYSRRPHRTALFVSLGFIGLTAAEPVFTPQVGTAVAFEVDRTRYNSFVKNWDFEKIHLVTAYIKSPEHFRIIFNPAPMMWRENIYEPKPEIYKSKSIILVARDFNNSVEEPFAMNSITVKDKVMAFHYTLHAGSELGDGLSHLTKCNSRESKWHPGKRFISVLVPKSEISKIIFIENNIQVGSLNLSAGQWISPTTPYLNPDGDR